MHARAFDSDTNHTTKDAFKSRLESDTRSHTHTTPITMQRCVQGRPTLNSHTDTDTPYHLDSKQGNSVTSGDQYNINTQYNLDMFVSWAFVMHSVDAERTGAVSPCVSTLLGI